MAKKTRETLKNHFRAGAKPTQGDFEDLIDSALNVIDDGIGKSERDGFKITQIGPEARLASFFDLEHKDALWFIRVDSEDGTLYFGSGDRGDILALTGEGSGTRGGGRVGVNVPDPEFDLDVAGVLRAEGRLGTPRRSGQKELRVPADGKWHDITPNLEGCHAFEVVARTGLGPASRSGKYALLHAFALNAFNPKGPFFNFLNLKKRIRTHQAYYRSRSDKLKLRWAGEEGSYRLQLRTATDYGIDVDAKPHCVRYYLTDLWFDAKMEGTRYEPDEDASQAQ
jgi:hypothetical protein